MDNIVALPPAIDITKLNALGQRLFETWGTYKSDRRQVEERWMRNLLQVKGVYDAEILNMIPSDRSKAYPRMTAWMVKGTVARLMQIAFPQTEKNYGVRPSPLPDLTTVQLQEVLDGLVQQAAQGGDPTQVVLKDEDIEKAILNYAKGKAERMEVKVQDDLDEMEYVSLARRIIRSAVIYGIGVLKGPLHRKVKARTWQRNQFTGAYTAVEVDKYKPLFEFLPVWSYYPDMTATALTAQDGTFERHILTRTQVEELAERPDFIAERVTSYLRDNTTGNFREEWWESQIKGEPKSNTAVVAQRGSRKYIVLSYWGSVTGHDLRAAGVSIADGELGTSFHANAWMLDSTVIKLKLSPYPGMIRHHHEFVFEEDDLTILGGSLPETLRDSQLSICETVRAALDNMSVIGPMVEVNDDLLTPGQDTSIRKHKTWRREGTGNEANIPAVRNITVDSHLTELRSLIDVFMGFADKESGLPPPSMGDVSGGGSEALRTQRNASMFLGAAALPVRDTLRNFDMFTVSVISALIAWNCKYDPNATRDGDHDVIARGSTSLIAKEVLAQSLEAFRAGLQPDELPHVKVRELLKERAKANDIPIDDLLEDEDVANQTIQRNAQVQQATVQAQTDLITAQVKRELATALEKEAKARTEDASIGTDVFSVLIDALKAGDKGAADQAKALIEAHKADSTRIAAEKPTGGASA